jgi:ComEC/Rec2-related protein
MLAGAVLAGAVAGVVSEVRTPDALAAALAASALSLVAPSRRGAMALLVLALASAAAAHGAAARDRALQPPLAAWFDHAAGEAERLTSPVDIDGTIAADAVTVGDSVRLIVDIERVRDATGWRRAPGRAQLFVGGTMAAGAVREWTAGRRISAPALLRRPQMLFNFGGASPYWQQLRRPFALAGSVKSAALVTVERGAWWREWASRARWRARDAAARFIAPIDPTAAAITSAILIGDRAGLDEDLVHRLQAAGTYHVIAISGGNVALLTGLCYGILRLLLRSPRSVAVLTLLATLAYGLVVGGDPSVARAITAAAIYLTATIVGLQPSPLATLRTVACALTIVDPLMVIDVGAWLSFGATLGILVLTGPILACVPWQGLPPRLRAVTRAISVLIAATCCRRAGAAARQCERVRSRNRRGPRAESGRHSRHDRRTDLGAHRGCVRPDAQDGRPVRVGGEPGLADARRINVAGRILAVALVARARRVDRVAPPLLRGGVCRVVDARPGACHIGRQWRPPRSRCV